jgi:glycosyltransferase involved in cell wall biosynthesis
MRSVGYVDALQGAAQRRPAFAPNGALMRVLHVMPDISRAFGGPTQALLGYLAAGRAAGIDAGVAAPEPPPADLDWVRRQAGGVPVDVFVTRGRGSARVSTTLLDHIRAQRDAIDVVHIHGLFNGISTFAARTCRRAKIPYVIGPFGTLSRYTFANRRRLLKRAYFSLLDAPAIRGAAAMLFTTMEERDEARRFGVVRTARSAVVPPPWIPDAAARVSEGRHRAGAPQGSRTETVLFLGRLHPIKALESLIDAWPAVHAARPNARLVLAGSGDPGYARELEARVAQKGIAHSVRFTGFVTGADKASWLAGADVFVLPSYHENFGVAALEAVASGVPAIVSPDVQLGPVVREHRLGAVVPRDPATLASGILSVLADSALRERCAVEGAVVVNSLFSPEVIGPQLRAMYELARPRSTT